MSDSPRPRRPRSPINALKVLNELREQKGLPKVGLKAKPPRLTAEVKRAVTLQELQRLFPEALTETYYEFSEAQARTLVRDVEFRLERIRSGKELPPTHS